MADPKPTRLTVDFSLAHRSTAKSEAFQSAPPPVDPRLEQSKQHESDSDRHLRRLRRKCRAQCLMIIAGFSRQHSFISCHTAAAGATAAAEVRRGSSIVFGGLRREAKELPERILGCDWLAILLKETAESPLLSPVHLSPQGEKAPTRIIVDRTVKGIAWWKKARCETVFFRGEGMDRFRRRLSFTLQSR